MMIVSEKTIIFVLLLNNDLKTLTSKLSISPICFQTRKQVGGKKNEWDKRSKG